MFKVMKIIFVMIVAAYLIPGFAMAEIKLGKHIDSLKLKGDLRVRFERHDKDSDAGKNTDDNNPRDRLRSRFRLGAFWKSSEEKWEIGAGLATGGLSSTSTNDTWSDAVEKEFEKDDSIFQTGDIRLDYAYAKHTIEIPGINKVNVIVGQQKNPFKSAWLLWDSDVRPAGFTGHADLGMVFGTAGAYDVFQNGNDIAMMYALQGGAKIKTGNISFLGTLSGYFYGGLDRYNDADSAEGEYVCKLPNKDYDYQIIDIYGKIDVELDKKIKVSPYLQLFYNTGADGKKGDGFLKGDLEPDSENMGWVMGFSAKMMDASFKLSYAQVGADSCVPYLKNADFGSGLHSGVNVQGAVIAAGYKITKHFGAELTAYLYEELEEVTKGQENKSSMQMYHIDLKYKF